MAKTWIRAEKQFTRRIGAQMVVGHPKHPDANGRVAEVDEGEAVNRLVDGGYAKRISRAEYRKEIDAVVGEPGKNMVDQVAGKAPSALVTMTDGQLHQMASDRGVDISGAKGRAEIVKLINAKEISVKAPPTNNAFARTAGDTRDSTLHPQTTGINSETTADGSTDRLLLNATGGDGSAEGVEDEADAAPGGSGAKGEGAQSGDAGGAPAAGSA